MTIDSFEDWSTTPSDNTNVAGISILGTGFVSGFDGALRTMMAQLKEGVQAHSTNLDVIASSTVAPAFNADVTVTVGTGGDFTTINAALAALSLIYGPRYKKGGVTAEARLLTGFVMAEQVIIVDVDLGWITITSVDAEVTIQRSALTEAVDVIYYPAWSAVGPRAVLPNIDVLFNMDTSGTATERNGIFVLNGAAAQILPGAGVKNAAARGLHVANAGARAKARGTNFSGAGEAAVRNSNGFVEVRESNLTNSAIGLKLAGYGITDAESADISGCAIGVEGYQAILRASGLVANGCGIAIQAWAAKIDAKQASFNNCTGAYVFEIRENSQVNLLSSSATGANAVALFAHSSQVNVSGADLSGAGTTAIQATYSSIVSASEVNVSGAGTYGVFSENGANVAATGSNAATAGSFGYRVANGGQIVVTGTTGGTFAQDRNIYARDGVIIDGGASQSFTTSSTVFAPGTDNTNDLGTPSTRFRRVHLAELRFGTAGDRRVVSGTGSPEGAITAPVASQWLRTDGGAGTTFYIKESGTGNTGWVGK